MIKKETVYTMRDDNYRQGLNKLIDYVNDSINTKNMSMIEIGSYAGESTELFTSNFKSVISIDPFLNDYDVSDITCEYMELTEVYKIFNGRMSKYKNFEHIKKTSDEAINDLKNIKVDLVYIDGLHTYEQVKKDIENYLPLINDGGFICGHDYHPVWQGVVNAIHEKLGVPDKLFQDTSWIKKIKH